MTILCHAKAYSKNTRKTPSKREYVKYKFSAALYSLRIDTDSKMIPHTELGIISGAVGL